MAPKPMGCVFAKPPGVPDAVDPVAPLAGSWNPKTSLVALPSIDRLLNL
jgi:hypothetical protein